MQHALKPYAKGTNGYAAGISHDPPSAELELDALIIGGGFAGVYLLHRLCQSGYKVKIIEAGSGLGGVWHWNNYPGARVDSQWPVYPLNIPEVYSTFDWQQQYAGAPELQRYFQHADEVLDISKDTIYNPRVDKTVWDDVTKKWNITCNTGLKVKTSYLHCCLSGSQRSATFLNGRVWTLSKAPWATPLSGPKKASMFAAREWDVSVLARRAFRSRKNLQSKPGT